MTAKIILAIITLCALVYSIYLLLTRKPLRVPAVGERRDGIWAQWRWLFFLAVAVITGCMTDMNVKDNNDSVVMCYRMVVPKGQVSANNHWTRGIKLAWRTLNTQSLKDRNFVDEKGKEEAVAAFGQALAKAVQTGKITQAQSDRLARLHVQLASHYWRSNSTMTCYDMMTMAVDDTKSLAQIQAQLDLLREAKSKGTLTQAVIDKAAASLRQEIEILARLDIINSSTKSDEYATRQNLNKALAALIAENKLEESKITQEATAIILQLEDVMPSVAAGNISPAGGKDK